jgi:hypothetical protein
MAAFLCMWFEDQDGNWDTQCGHKFTFTDGDPEANGFEYCPYCGKTLVESPHEPDDRPDT